MNGLKIKETMRTIILTVVKYTVLFIIDGLIYVGMEYAFRGRSHISMFILGGICGVIVGGLNNWYTWEMPLIEQMFISAGIITALEYITGCIVNLKLGLNVWDYSDLPFNLHGQICIYFSVLWVFVSLIAIVLDDLLRYTLFGEELKPYKFI